MYRYEGKGRSASPGVLAGIMRATVRMAAPAAHRNLCGWFMRLCSK